MLIAWAFGWREILSFQSGEATMKANTALAIGATGAALIFRTLDTPRAQAAARVVAGAVCALVVATLFEYVARVDLSIDQLLIHDPWETIGAPGRMSLMTAVCLLALNTALLGLDVDTRRGRPAEWLAVVALAVSFVSFAGYVLGDPRLLHAPTVTTVAFPTAATLLLLSVGVLLARPEVGIAGLVMSSGFGGMVARRLVPAAAVVSLLTARVELWGEEAGIWNAALGRAAGVVVKVFLLGGLALWTAAALRREESAREWEHARLRALLDVLPVGIVLCDKPGGLATINPAAMMLFGGEPPGCHPSPRALWGGTGLPAAPSSWGLLATLADGRTRIAEEVEVESIDGKRTILAYSAPVREADGQVSGACGGFVDVTERKRVERELAALKDGLEDQVRRRTADLAALNRELETFAYSVSHDLRAPLRAADGFAAMLEELGTPGFDADQLGMVRRIRAAMQRMAALIDAMLALARVGRAVPRPAALDLAAMAREIAAELSALEPSRVIEWEIPERMPAVGDPTLVRTALDNLLRNAWKFTKMRTPARIALRQSVRDGIVEYTVTDNGAGFDSAYADRLFEPFERLHTAQEFEGTGVGLAIVRRIIERHGGRVRAESTVGQGASFIFTLGLDASAVESAKVAEENEPPRLPG
ncbi:MAG: ATP-binding protein [Pseudomonadota bacterium]|nr:ATP-binding protein [Pseudomonadota bacterium]